MKEAPDDRALEGWKNEVFQEIPMKYQVLLALESILIIGIVLFLILSKFNKKSFKEVFINKDKVIIFGLTSVLLSIGIIFVLNIFMKRDYSSIPFKDISTEKEVKTGDVEKGTVVDEKIIDLNNYSSNITIEQSGIYELSGEFEHTLLVDADGEVTIVLNGVSIKNEITAAIANISANDLVIELEKNSKNVLSDGGSSEYDACLYSMGNLTIRGDGYLEVYGKQSEGEGIATETRNIMIDGGNIYIESNDDGINAGGDGGLITINDGNISIKASGDGIDSNKNLVINGGTIFTAGSPLGGDAGIDTDDGFSINGGTVVALGSGMLEMPLSTSKQNTISWTLNDKISEGTLVTLLDESDKVVVSFIASVDAKILIISSNKIKNGTYTLYAGGKNSGTLEGNVYVGGKYTRGDKVSVNGESEFKVTDTVTNIK